MYLHVSYVGYTYVGYTYVVILMLVIPRLAKPMLAILMLAIPMWVHSQLGYQKWEKKFKDFLKLLFTQHLLETT